jgi:hypothetical protein
LPLSSRNAGIAIFAGDAAAFRFDKRHLWGETDRWLDGLPPYLNGHIEMELTTICQLRIESLVEMIVDESRKNNYSRSPELPSLLSLIGPEHGPWRTVISSG